jgi:transaldolase
VIGEDGLRGVTSNPAIFEKAMARLFRRPQHRQVEAWQAEAIHEQWS